MDTEDQERDGEKLRVVEVPFELLQGIFDLAVNTLDFGSGFWDDDDVRIGRAVAELIGVDPLEATPSNYRQRFAHTFAPRSFNFGAYIRCAVCSGPEEFECHQSDPAPTP